MLKKILEYITNSCYHRIIVGGVSEDNMNDCVLDIQDLVRYVLFKYYSKYGKPISAIKLQKTLYFLFACWGGFIAKNDIKDVEEKLDYSPYLFDANFQAWVYGPVLPEIYSLYKDGNISFDNVDFDVVFKDKEFVRETIDDLLNDLFKISDFKLVSLSHDDDCWQRHFDISSDTHNENILKEEIIQEYASRETI